MPASFEEKIDILSLSTIARLDFIRKVFSDWKDDPSSKLDIFVRKLSAPYLTSELVKMSFSPEDKAYLEILKGVVKASPGLDLYTTNGDICPSAQLNTSPHDVMKAFSPQRFAVNDTGLLCSLRMDGLPLGELSATLLHQRLSLSERRDTFVIIFKPGSHPDVASVRSNVLSSMKSYCASKAPHSVAAAARLNAELTKFCTSRPQGAPPHTFAAATAAIMHCATKYASCGGWMSAARTCRALQNISFINPTDLLDACLRFRGPGWSKSVEEMLEADTSNEGRFALLQALKKLVNIDDAARSLFINSLRVVIWSLKSMSADNLGILKELFQDVQIRDLNVIATNPTTVPEPQADHRERGLQVLRTVAESIALWTPVSINVSDEIEYLPRLKEVMRCCATIGANKGADALFDRSLEMIRSSESSLKRLEKHVFPLLDDWAKLAVGLGPLLGSGSGVALYAAAAKILFAQDIPTTFPQRKRLVVYAFCGRLLKELDESLRNAVPRLLEEHITQPYIYAVQFRDASFCLVDAKDLATANRTIEFLISTFLTRLDLREIPIGSLKDQLPSPHDPDYTLAQVFLLCTSFPGLEDTLCAAFFKLILHNEGENKEDVKDYVKERLHVFLLMLMDANDCGFHQDKIDFSKGAAREFAATVMHIYATLVVGPRPMGDDGVPEILDLAREFLAQPELNMRLDPGGMLYWKSRQHAGRQTFLKLGSAAERKEIIGNLYDEVVTILDPGADILPIAKKRAAVKLEDSEEEEERVDDSGIFPFIKRRRI